MDDIVFLDPCRFSTIVGLVFIGTPSWSIIDEGFSEKEVVFVIRKLRNAGYNV